MLNILLSYVIYLPAAILCYLPVKGKFRYGILPSLAVMTPVLCIMIVLSTYLTWRFDLRENDLLIPMMLLSFTIYHFSLKVPLIKTLSVFTVVISLLSILTNFAACFDAVNDPASGLDSYTMEFSLFQVGACVLMILLLAYPFMKYGQFVIAQPVSPTVWFGIILFSLTIIFTNLAILPVDYYLFHEDRPAIGIFVVLSAQLVVWALMLLILYSSISSVLTISKMKEQNRIWQMQESQFQSQQKYIRASEKARHDFRHSILTLAEMYEAGDMDAVGAYLEQYIESMPKNEIITYCRNAALNALLNFYAHITSMNRIAFILRVSIPDELGIRDVDLCNIVGNILENAVIACQEAEEKQIQLTILAEEDGQLYIVAVNSFDGKVRVRSGTYLSKERGRTGIGLSSIQSTAESYGGLAQFSHEGKFFYSNVAIPNINKQFG
ncbi:MAG: GHKL domain-containing protein [Firmicutes bacterium]|nr:GHKL domain-containing protein [Bacillota bacterium]